MALVFRCRHCLCNIKVKDRLRGKTMHCPLCGITGEVDGRPSFTPRERIGGQGRPWRGALVTLLAVTLVAWLFRMRLGRRIEGGDPDPMEARRSAGSADAVWGIHLEAPGLPEKKRPDS